MQTNRRLVAVFFSMLAAVALWQTTLNVGWTRSLWLWLFVNTNLLSLAYWLNQPRLILGKTRNGRLNPLFLVANLPWLLFSWTVWWLQQRLSREAAAHRLGDSGWTIGAYPGRRYPLGTYDVVIDLTAEFPAPHRGDAVYGAVPHLDAAALARLPDIALLHQLGIGPRSRVLVHCAQGHGRSATWCAAALTAMGHFESAQQAHAWILGYRPLAKLSYSQRKQLKAMDDAGPA